MSCKQHTQTPLVTDSGTADGMHAQTPHAVNTYTETV